MANSTETTQLTEIRSDLWSSMSSSERAHQLSLVIDRKCCLLSMNISSNPTLAAAYAALEHAESVLVDMLAS